MREQSNLTSQDFTNVEEVYEEWQAYNVNTMLRFGGILIAANVDAEGGGHYIVGRPKGVSFNTLDHAHDCEAAHGR